MRTIGWMGREWPLAGLLAVLAILYVGGSLQHAARVNTDAAAFDQSSYLRYARQMRATGYAVIGDRNRMPVYPFLQSLVASPGIGEEDQFQRGKLLNIALSLAILIVVYLLLRRALPALMAVNLVLIAAFLVFIFKAAYVQCELVYYLLSFCSFLLMLETLREPDWRCATLAGALAGLTQLTKASALPGLVIFLFVGLTWHLYRAARRSIRRGGQDRRPMAGLVALGLVALTFLAVVFPYIRTSKRVFGRYFYNVNSTFYIWYDTQDQVAVGTRLHGDREGWPKLPADEIPGPAKYFREHDAGQALRRISAGLRELHHTAVRSYGHYKYVLLYAGFALALVIARPRAWFPPGPGVTAQILFCLCYFAGYIVLFAWASASLWGANRMSLQLFLPMMYCFAKVIAASSERIPPLRVGRARVHPALAFNVAIACALAPDIWLVITGRLMSMAGGH